MLSSRLFRNTGIRFTPTFRSLDTLCRSFPTSMSFQHRLGSHFKFSISSVQSQTVEGDALRSTTGTIKSPSPSFSAPTNSSQSSTTSHHTHRGQIDPPEPRLSLTFTCTASNCSTRSSHTFTKRAYEKGVVLVECPGCKNR